MEHCSWHFNTSFKLVSLSLSRSPLSKTPKQVFFNPINILSLLHTLLLFYNLLFHFTSNLYFTVFGSVLSKGTKTKGRKGSKRLLKDIGRRILVQVKMRKWASLYGRSDDIAKNADIAEQHKVSIKYFFFSLTTPKNFFF